jgi:hypothetical protein
MARADERRSPAGRPITVRAEVRSAPAWVLRRRRAYRLIDTAAECAKHAVRRWLVPRPARARRPGTEALR